MLQSAFHCVLSWGPCKGSGRPQSSLESHGSHTQDMGKAFVALSSVSTCQAGDKRPHVSPFLVKLGSLLLQLNSNGHLYPSHVLLEGSWAVVYSSELTTNPCLASYRKHFLSYITHSFKCYMKSHMPDAPGGQRIATTGQMCFLFLGSASLLVSLAWVGFGESCTLLWIKD